MKQTITLFCIILFLNVNAASVDDLVTALKTSGKAVQSIHGYPADLQDGKHHFVEVTSITISDGMITIIETWTDWKGSKATTTLKGKLVNGVVDGKWESSFSSGNWRYDFNTGKGTWNKPKSMIKSFDEYQPLLFKVVSKSEVKDGFNHYSFK